MREIQFRGWHVAHQCMFSAAEMAADQLTLLPTGQFINVSGDSTRLSQIFPADQFIPLQYTGLKDKNGKEIYEGDLIVHNSRNGDKPHPVIYHTALAAFCGDYGLKYPLQETELAEIEVIGNIYENKDLIK